MATPLKDRCQIYTLMLFNNQTKFIAFRLSISLSMNFVELGIPNQLGSACVQRGP
jgi:hypothetical protein